MKSAGENESTATTSSFLHLLLPVLDFVVVLRNGGVDLLDAEPDAEGLLLQGVFLLLQGLDLLHHGVVLLLDLRELGLKKEFPVSQLEVTL